MDAEQQDLDAERAAIDVDPLKPGVQSFYGADEYAAGFAAGRADRAWTRCWWTLAVCTIAVVVTVLAHGRLW